MEKKGRIDTKPKLLSKAFFFLYLDFYVHCLNELPAGWPAYVRSGQTLFLLLLLPRLAAINGIVVCYSYMLFIQLVVTRMASAYTMMIANIDEYVIDVIDLDMSLKA